LISRKLAGGRQDREPATSKSVPVGKYAKAALEKLGAWTAAEPKIRDGGERAAAALTLGGAWRGRARASSIPPTPRSSPGVKVVGHFPRPTATRRSSIRVAATADRQA